MLILKYDPCTAVSTIVPHMTLFFLPQYVLQYLRTSGLDFFSLPTYARSLLLEQALFFRGGSPRTRAASYSR